MKYGELQEPKPPRFPLFIDLRPSKNVNIEKLSTNFDDILDKKSNQNQNSEQKNNNQTNKPISPKLKTAHSLLQMSIIHQGVKQLPHHMLANAEFIGSKQNFEGINNPAYINYAAAFQAGFNSNTINDIKKKKKELQDPTHADPENEDDTQAFTTDLTYAHNLNLFKKLDDINPFKKLDTKNHKLFEESPMHQLLTNKFLSPLSLLGDELFTKTKNIINKINQKTPKITEAHDVYTDNNIETFEINSNYNSIEKNNNNDEAQWEKWPEETTAHYLLKRHADIKQYTKVIRQFSGKINDQQRHIDRIEKQENTITKNQTKLDEITEKINEILKKTLTEIQENPSIMNDPTVIEKLTTQIEDTNEITELIENSDLSITSESQDQFIFYKTQLDQIINLNNHNSEKLKDYFENKSLKKSKEWWNSIGKNLNQSGILMPFGLMAESAEHVFKQSHLELNTNTTTQTGKLNEKLITDTANHLIKNEFHKHKPNSTITASSLMLDRLEYGETIYQALIKQNIINKHGTIINFDPNDMFQNFNLSSDNENNRIRKILKQATQGKSSLSTYDITQINNHHREDIKLIDPHGDKWDLTTLITSLENQKSSKETYKQARKIYNILFDILETMAGDNLKKDGKLKAKTTQVDNGISVPIYQNAEWLEYNKAIKIENEETNIIEEIPGWEKVEGKPLTMIFENEQKAQSLFDTIKTTLLHLEPLVASFTPTHDPDINNKEKHYKNGEIKETATRVLIDNEGELTKNGIITKESTAHRYDTDILAQKEFFQTSHWKHISTFIKSSIMLEIGTSIFSKSQINHLNKKQNKKKNDEYKERKEEWEEKKYEEKVDEKKKEKRRKKEQKLILKKYDNKNKKRKLELKKEIKKHEKKKEAQKKQREKSSKKINKNQNNNKKVK